MPDTIDRSTKLIWVNLTKIKKVANYHWSLEFADPRVSFLAGVDFWCDRSSSIPNHHLITVADSLRMPTKTTHEVCWVDATQDRVNRVQKILDLDHNTIITIFWSGGIDSTCIVSALLLYLPRKYWKNIKIGLSGASILENPYFYRDHILPNFETVDLASAKQDTSLKISGSLGDKLMFNELMIRWAVTDRLGQSLKNNVDALIKFIDDYVNDGVSHGIMWEKIKDTASAHDVDLETVADALWWMGFNFGWIGMKFEVWGKFRIHKTENLWDFQNNYVEWFASDLYQQWAMTQSGRLSHLRDFFTEYKKEAKRLIYELDQNKFYRDFKQKTVSNNMFFYDQPNQTKEWILAVDHLGKKIYTTDLTLIRDLSDLGW